MINEHFELLHGSFIVFEYFIAFCLYFYKEVWQKENERAASRGKKHRITHVYNWHRDKALSALGMWVIFGHNHIFTRLSVLTAIQPSGERMSQRT